MDIEDDNRLLSLVRLASLVFLIRLIEKPSICFGPVESCLLAASMSAHHPIKGTPLSEKMHFVLYIIYICTSLSQASI